MISKRAVRERERIAEWLHRFLVETLGVDASRIDSSLDFADVGLDSVEATEVRRRLETWLGRPVPETLLSDAPTIADFLDAVATGGELTAAPAGRWAAERAPDRHPFERAVNPALARRLRQLHVDVTFVRGRGCHLWDAEGRRYLDFLAMYGALPFGHHPPEIWRALERVRDDADPAFVQPSLLGRAGELAERLLALAPDSLRFVTFTNSGAESVEAAIKMARAATGRRDVLTTHGAFHGKTLASLSASGSREHQAPFGLPLPGFARTPFGDAEALERTIGAQPDRFAAFLVEPIQGEGGVREAPAGYLAAAREVCRAAGVMFVVDEVQTGLGRTGSLFAIDGLDLEPDAVTLAKALGGGLVPCGACLSSERMFSEVFGLKHSSTFAGNALAASAGLATLDRLERDHGALLRAVVENGSWLRERLERLKERFPGLIRDIRGRGFLLGIELGVRRSDWQRSVLGVAAEQRQLAQLVAAYLLRVERLRVAPALNQGRVLRIEPPLIATREQCAEAAAGIERAFEMLSAGDTAALYGSLLDRAPRAPVRSEARPAHNPPLPQADEPRFGFVMHPLDPGSYAEFDVSLARLSQPELARFAESADGLLDPFIGHTARTTSKTGRTAYGEFVVLPRTPETLQALPPADARSEVAEAIELLRARGARVVGLGAYTSIVTHGGRDVRGLGVPITTGNSFTASAGVEALLASVRRLGASPEDQIAAVLGGAGAIGGAVAALLAEHMGRLVLLGNPVRRPEANRRRLLDSAARACHHVVGRLRAGARPAGGLARRLVPVLREVPAGAPPEAFVPIAERLESSDGAILIGQGTELLAIADLVTLAVSDPRALVSGGSLKRGAVVLDLSRPRSVSPAIERERDDVLVLDGGVVDLPGQPDLGPIGLPRGKTYACMAETMLLALEGRFEDVGLGSELSLAEVVAQGALSRKHGFLPALHSFGREIRADQWERLRAARGVRS